MTRLSPGRRATTLLVAGVLAVGGTATAAAAASSNSHAQQLYSEAQSNAGHFAGITFTGGGTSYKIIHEQGYDNFAFDFGAVPRGYHRATDHALVVMHGGTVSEEVDTLSVKGRPSVRVWLDNNNQTAIGQVLTRKRCAVYFTRDTGSYITVGSPFGFADNPSFSAPTSTKNGWILKSTFPVQGSTAHERDSLVQTKSGLLWSAFSVTLRGGKYSGAALSASHFGYRRHQGFENPPELGRC